jgi:hypothetical protein
MSCALFELRGFYVKYSPHCRAAAMWNLLAGRRRYAASYSANISYQVIAPKVGGSSSATAGTLTGLVQPVLGGPYFAIATDMASSTPAPSVSSAVNLGTGVLSGFCCGQSNTSFGSASETLTYSMEITGPTGNVGVTVNATGGVVSSSTSTSGPLIVFAQSFLTVQGLFTDSVTSSAVGEVLNFADLNTYSFTTNTIYTVRLLTQVQGSLTGGLLDQNLAVSAMVDPTFSIANSVANPGQYGFLFSSGIGNVSDVPELSTWAMILLGFAAIGLMAYGLKSRPALMLAHPGTRVSDENRPTALG